MKGSSVDVVMPMSVAIATAHLHTHGLTKLHYGDILTLDMPQILKLLTISRNA